MWKTHFVIMYGCCFEELYLMVEILESNEDDEKKVNTGQDTAVIYHKNGQLR